jgi:hypothetical protein
MLSGAISPEKSGNPSLYFSFIILLALLALVSGSCSQQAKLQNNAQALECAPVLQEHRLARVSLPQVQPEPATQLAFHAPKPFNVGLNKHHNRIHCLANTAPAIKNNVLAMSKGSLHTTSLKQAHNTEWWGKNGILSYILLIITLIIILSLVVFFLTTFSGISGFVAFAIGGGIGIAMVIIYMATHPVG